MHIPISRRNLLKLLATTAGGVGLVGMRRWLTASADALPTLLPRAYIPIVAAGEAPTPTSTATPTPTGTNTPTHTPTATSTSTLTPTPTETHTPTPTQTSTPTATGTTVATETTTSTSTSTAAATATQTRTLTATHTPAPTRTSTATATGTTTPTTTPTPTQTGTPTLTKTSSPTLTSTATPTQTPTATSTGSRPKVIHVHSPNATTWDFSTGWYGNYVSQSVVDAMADRGLLALTNTTTIADAWRAIIPAYVTGQKIAIKISLNNATCDDSDQVIDAVPQPINAVIRGLKAIGAAENDILIYDVTRGWHDGQMPARLVSKVRTLYPGVQFHATAGSCATELGYSSVEKIHFNVPTGKPTISDRPICNALVNATYLINMPVMKKHMYSGVSLAFKNHLGSFEQCDLLHWSVFLDDPAYTSAYNVMVDLYNNWHFKNKTVLTIADGLYGGRFYNYEVPSRWWTFGDQAPNSLFFARDPVAIDCAMYDLLDAEDAVPTGSDDYLRLAAAAGLGTFEHGQPWGSGYQTIDYLKFEV